jgi:broad specificity phosphatase PhoE
VADVVVVSHVSPIKAAIAWALGVGDEVSWRMFLDVAALCRVRLGPRGPSLTSYGERVAVDPAADKEGSIHGL